MAVSVGAKPARAKATPVSRERFMMPAGFGGAWPGFETTRRATHSDQAPLVWRAPEGPEGLAAVPVGGGRARAGFEIDHSERSSRVAISRAAGPDGARNTSGAASNKLNRKLRLHRRCEGRKRAWPRCPWAAAGPGRGAGGRRQGQGGPRDRPLRAQLACGDLAGGPPPTGTLSGQAHRTGSTAAGPSGARNTSGATRPPGYAKGAGTEVPAPCRLTQPLPRRGSGRMTVSPGDGDASTGTCRQRRPLPGQPHRSDHRSPCAQDAEPHQYSGRWPEPRAQRNRSSRQ